MKLIKTLINKMGFTPSSDNESIWLNFIKQIFSWKKDKTAMLSVLDQEAQVTPDDVQMVSSSEPDQSPKDSSESVSSEIVQIQTSADGATTSESSIQPANNPVVNSTVNNMVNNAVVSSQAESARISYVEWNKLVRNAKDGGANSVLAAKVLNKTSELLKEADEVVLSMLDSGSKIKKDVSQLNEFSTEIKSISMQARIIAFNVSIEASRSGAAGNAFKVVAVEMKKLSDAVHGLTSKIESSLSEINVRVSVNDKKCNEVAETFRHVHSEVDQFNNLMMRIEELSTTQASELGHFEKIIEEEHGFSGKSVVNF